MKRLTLKRAGLVILLAIAAAVTGVEVNGATHAGSTKAPAAHMQPGMRICSCIPALDP